MKEYQTVSYTHLAACTSSHDGLAVGRVANVASGIDTRDVGGLRLALRHDEAHLVEVDQMCIRDRYCSHYGRTHKREIMTEELKKLLQECDTLKARLVVPVSYTHLHHIDGDEVEAIARDAGGGQEEHRAGG